MIELNQNILRSILTVLNQMNDLQYSSTKDYLSNASFGKHLRHILDFYYCLLKHESEGCLCYDYRERKHEIEENVLDAKLAIEEIIESLNQFSQDENIILKQSFGEKELNFKTTLFRELGYALEHSIHHMAILKIILKISYPEIKIDQKFGVAFSTLGYQEKK